MLMGRALSGALKTISTRPFREIFFRATPLLYGSDPLGKSRPNPVSAARFNVRAAHASCTWQTVTRPACTKFRLSAGRLSLLR